MTALPKINQGKTIQNPDSLRSDITARPSVRAVRGAQLTFYFL